MSRGFMYFALSLLMLGTIASDGISANVIYPSQKKEYVSSIYNVHAHCWGICPPRIIQAKTREEVSKYVRNAYENNSSFTIRSGGHSYVCRGLEDHLDLLDLSKLNHKKLVEYDDLVEITFGPGNRAGEIAGPLSRRNLTIVTGECVNVGFGGLWTGPGAHPMYFRNMSTLTHLQELVIVSSFGSIVHIKKTGAEFLDRSPYEELNEDEYADVLREVFRTQKPRITDWIVTDFIYRIPKNFTVPGSIAFLLDSNGEGDLWKNIAEELVLKKNDCKFSLFFSPTRQNFLMMSCLHSKELQKLSALISAPEYHYHNNHPFEGKPMRYYSTDLWFEEESDFLKAFDLWTSKMDELKKTCDHIVIESYSGDDPAFGSFFFSGMVHWDVTSFESEDQCLHAAIEVENSIRDVTVGKMFTSDNLQNCFEAEPLTPSELALRQKMDHKNILFDGFQQGKSQMTCSDMYNRPDSCTEKGINFEDFASIDGSYGWPSRKERFGLAVKDFAKNNISDFEVVEKINGTFEDSQNGHLTGKFFTSLILILVYLCTTN